MSGYVQELDLRRGVLLRRFTVTDRQGRRTAVAQRRLVSMADPYLAGLEATFVALELVRPARDPLRDRRPGPQRRGDALPRARRPPPRHALRGHRRTLHRRRGRGDYPVPPTRLVGREAPPARQRRRDVRRRPRCVAEDGYAAWTCRSNCPRRTPARSRRWSPCSPHGTARSPSRPKRPGTRSRCAPGFEPLLARHVLAWDHLWERCDLELTGHEHAALVLRLHIFHLLQTVSEHSADLDVGIPARGLSGEAYRGHVFWDEMFVFPYLTLRTPDLARALLLYRWRRLPQARKAAHEAGQAGRDVPLAERRERAGGDADAAPQPPLGPVAAGQLAAAAARRARRRVQHLAVLRGDRGPRLPGQPRRGADPRDRPVLGRRRDLRPRGRPLRPARRHGTGRVPRRLPVAGRAGPGQQRLHQRHGRLDAHQGTRRRPGAAGAPPSGAAGPARGDPVRAGAVGPRQPQAAAALAGGRRSSPSSRATRSSRSSAGSTTSSATATSAGSTGSSKPRATAPTATRSPSRPTCSCSSTCCRPTSSTSCSTGSATPGTAR